MTFSKCIQKIVNMMKSGWKLYSSPFVPKAWLEFQETGEEEFVSNSTFQKLREQKVITSGPTIAHLANEFILLE